MTETRIQAETRQAATGRPAVLELSSEPTTLALRPHGASPSRVLHVMIRAGAGQATAAKTFMVATPEFEHHFLLSPDLSCPVEGSFDQATSVEELPAGWWQRARALRTR